MRIGYVWAVFSKEWRDLLTNRLLLGAVAFPAIVFAAIPTGLVAFIQARDLDPNQLGQIQQYIANFPNIPAKLAAQAFIVTNFMAYFLLIPAMVPMAIATQSVIGEKVARSLEPQLATPLEVSELLTGKTLAAALPAVTATWLVFIGYGLVNGLIADPRLTRFVFSDVWITAMLTLVPLICLLSVLLGIVISSRVNDARTAQQIGGFVVIPIIGIAVAQFFGGTRHLFDAAGPDRRPDGRGPGGSDPADRFMGVRSRVHPDPPHLSDGSPAIRCRCVGPSWPACWPQPPWAACCYWCARSSSASRRR